ncbi:MAG: SpoIIE family protein phosphatase [Chloroflexi bacterium]|nr:SpoIIE family protein phosphatase [Chloroflexota bacterium]
MGDLMLQLEQPVFFPIYVIEICIVVYLFRARSTLLLLLAVSIFSVFIADLAGLYFNNYYAPGARYGMAVLAIAFLVHQVLIIQFIYHFPANLHPQESKAALIVTTLLSLSVGIPFMLANIMGVDQRFYFGGQYYLVDRWSAEWNFVSLLMNVWQVVVPIRKAILMSSYHGRLEPWLARPVRWSVSAVSRFLIARLAVPVLKVVRPRGREAQGMVVFAVYSSWILVAGTLWALEYLGLAANGIWPIFTFPIYPLLMLFYLNYSGRPSSFMVKIVGVTLLVSMMALSRANESVMSWVSRSFDSERLAEVTHVATLVNTNDLPSAPATVAYVMARPLAGGSYTLLLARDPAFSTDSLAADEAEDRVRAGTSAADSVEAPVERQRLYRGAYAPRERHYIHYDFVRGDTLFEVGYRNLDFRRYVHETAVALDQVALFTGLAVLLAVPFYFWLNLTTSLTALLGGVRRVRAGDLSAEVPVQIDDEIGYLTHSFNGMVGSLREHAQEVEHRRALELEQALLRQELTHAWDIQRRLLPTALPPLPDGLTIAVRFRPARETSGDFYEVISSSANTHRDEQARLQIAVGDVAGKGMGAALVMAVAQTTLRAVTQPDTSAGSSNREGAALSPAAALRRVGQLLHRDLGRRDFVACSLATIEATLMGAGRSRLLRLRLANAAQVPPLLCRRGVVQELAPDGERLPLGVLVGPAYEELALELQTDDVLVFASDGLPEAPARSGGVAPAADREPVVSSLAVVGLRSEVTEPLGAVAVAAPAPLKAATWQPAPADRRATGKTTQAPLPGELFGFERLMASARYWSVREPDAEAIAVGIWADVLAWSGESPDHDDMTLLVVRVSSPRPDPGRVGPP